MRSAPHRLATRLLLLAIPVALAACGTKSGEQESTRAAGERTLPEVSTVTLRVAIDLPDTLVRAAAAWAAERSAHIEWSAPDATELAATLRSIPADALDALVAADAVRPFSSAGEARATEHFLAESGRRETHTFGLAWRARLFALRGEDAVDWAALARVDDDLGLQAEALTDAFLGFAATTGALLDGSLDARSEAAVEALAFLTDLSARATMLPVEELAAGRPARSIVAMHADPRLHDRWSPLPAPEADSTRAVLARLELLVLPRGGDHPDLGDELARWLTEPAQASLLFARDPSRVPLLRSLGAEDAAEASVLALRSHAVAAPYRGVDAQRWNVMLEEAVRASVERRRHPAAALTDADRRRQERSEP